jgi:hypothetical protein
MKKDGFCEYKILKDIAMLKLKEEVTFQELAIKIHTGRTHPYFIQTVEMLIDKNIIKVTRIIGITQLLKINNDKLIDYIYDSKFFNEEIVRFIAFANPLHNI